MRIEDTVPEHPKHLRAGPAASWLWICGLAYAQRQLSDGFIPIEAVALLWVKGAAQAIRLAEVLVAVGLFDKVEGGYRIHDYLTYNASRVDALQRRGEQHAAKVVAGRAGSRRRWQTDSTGHKQDDSRPLADAASKPIAPSHPIPYKKQTSSVVPAKKPPDPHVKDFLIWFQSEYKARRHGAEYLVRWEKHGTLVKRMLGATDLDRLKKYAQILLSDKTDEEFIVATDRGIEILNAKFSWLSDRLATWEKRQQQTS